MASTTNQRSLDTLRGLACLRMPLFACLPGLIYGLHPFADDSRAFLVGKARRLLVPMLFVGTAFALAQSFLPQTNYADSHGAKREWLLLHLEPVGHFWFVEALFSIFMLVWALERARLLASPGRFAGTGGINKVSFSGRATRSESSGYWSHRVEVAPLR